jgi:uncharacterized membrane protein
MQKQSKNKVSAEILIDAPGVRVWEVWSSFGNVADYVASIPKSYSIGDTPPGVGAMRRCDISNKMKVDETITAWEPGEGYSLEVTTATGVPIKKMLGSFTLAASGHETRATISMEYEMKGIARFFPIKGMMRQQAKDHLLGLKHHIETGQSIEPKMLRQLRKSYAGVCRATG